MIKVCVECKWYRNNPESSAVCTRMAEALESWGVDSVDYINRSMTCFQERKYGKIMNFLARRCGKEGKFFVPREKSE